MSKKLSWEKTVTDKITGFTGKIIGRCDYSTGCRQYLVAPPAGKEGDFRKSLWFDEDRIITQKKNAKKIPKGGPQAFAPTAK